MVPSHAAAAALLLSLSPSIWLRRHASAVADVASFLADAAIREGHPVDRSIIETAALLHDLDKALPTDHPLRVLGHGHAGARWLIEYGYPELAPVVASHPVGRLMEQPYDDWVRSTTLEQRVVAYADKRAQRRVVTLDQRFARWSRKHPDMDAELTSARQRAGLLEAEMCALAGITPGEVRRRRWATSALRAASVGDASLRDADTDPNRAAPA